MARGVCMPSPWETQALRSRKPPQRSLSEIFHGLAAGEHSALYLLSSMMTSFDELHEHPLSCGAIQSLVQ